MKVVGHVIYSAWSGPTFTEWGRRGPDCAPHRAPLHTDIETNTFRDAEKCLSERDKSYFLLRRKMCEY